MHALDSVNDAIDTAMGGFEPENVEDLGSWLEGLPGIYERLSGALTTVADRFVEEFPIHPDVAEHLREMASGAAGQQEYAAEAHGIFRTSHEADLDRLENPRAGEEFMDASQQ